MAFVLSNWKVTFDYGGANAFELCNFTDELDDELQFPWTQQVDISKPTRARAAVKFGRGRVETTLTLGVWKSFSTHAAARNYLLAHCASLPLGMAKGLRIDVSGGSSYLLSTAVLASGTPKMTCAVGTIRTWVQYVIQGGTFSIV